MQYDRYVIRMSNSYVEQKHFFIETIPNMTTNVQWHIVYTRPNCEKKVTQLLNKKGLIAYCPVNIVSSPSRFRSQMEIPLFSSYVFVLLTPDQFSEIKKINGVINILFWKGTPAIVPKEDIAAIRLFLKHHKEICLLKTAVISEQAKLAVEGEIASLRLPALGYVLQAQEATASVQVLETTVREKRVFDRSFRSFSFAWK